MKTKKEQVIDEIHTIARKRFHRRRTILHGLHDLMQADLMEFIPYARINKGYKYVLVVINCFSKYVWARPLKSKTANEVSAAMEDILKKFKIKNIQTDDGREFFNNIFAKMCKKYNVNHYSTFSVIKASIAERVIRTLKHLIYKNFNLIGKYNWINDLERIVDKYNSTKHSVTQMTPKQANLKKNEKFLLENVYSFIKVSPKAKLKVGDIVRISKYKTIFEKSYTPNFSTELFKIVKIQLTNPVTYILEDMTGQPISGGFYEQELYKTKHPDIYLVEKILRKKGNKFYVKWLGLNNNHNSWVFKKDIY